MNWKKRLAMVTEVPSCILSQYLWYNSDIQVDNSSVYFLKFTEKNINYVSQLFSDNGSINQWHEFKREHNLHESFFSMATINRLYSTKMDNYYKRKL